MTNYRVEAKFEWSKEAFSLGWVEGWSKWRGATGVAGWCFNVLHM